MSLYVIPTRGESLDGKPFEGPFALSDIGAARAKQSHHVVNGTRCQLAELPAAPVDLASVKGIRATVLTDPYGDPSSMAIAGHYAEVIMLGEDLPERMRTHFPSLERPAVTLRHAHGRHHVHPILDPAPGRIGYMASGAFIHSTDPQWRAYFGHDLPIRMHDYSERYDRS